MPKLRNVIRTRALSVTSPAFYSLSPSQSFSCCVRSLSETLSSRFKVCGSCSRPTLCQMVSFQQISSLSHLLDNVLALTQVLVFLYMYRYCFTYFVPFWYVRQQVCLRSVSKCPRFSVIRHSWQHTCSRWQDSH